MVVLDRVFKVDLANINQTRAILYQNVYNTLENIQLFKNIIQKHIDCIGDIVFDPCTYTFTIKVRKSFITKFPSHRHESDCYYRVVSAIMVELLSYFKINLISAFSQIYIDPVSMYRDIVSQTVYPLSNLCHIVCIGDSLIQIKL